MNGQAIRTFLSANGADGFMSLYPRFFEGKDQYVVKGGPGTGKSTMMKSVAKESLHNGYFTEYIYCSSDAQSLDGVYIAALNSVICDGTAPHTADPKYPGACGEIFNLSECWNSKELKKSKDEIIELNKKISACYKKAYRYLKAAGCVYEDKRQISAAFFDKTKADEFTRQFIRKYIPDKNKTRGAYLDRYLSSFTPQGYVTFKDTIYTFADNICVIKDNYGLSHILIETFADAAASAGYDVYRFLDPLLPEQSLHIAIPELDLAVVTSCKKSTFEPLNMRTVKIERFLSDEIFDVKNKLKYADRIIEMSENCALEQIKQAKQMHDDLEDIYIGAMDFDKAARMTAFAMTKIFIK